MAPEPLEAMHELRAFMFERVYMSDTAAGQKHVAIDVIRRLVDHHLAHPELIPATYRDTEADQVTQVVDYVSGMTDRFALAMHDRLFDADATLPDDAVASLTSCRTRDRGQVASWPASSRCVAPTRTLRADSARQALTVARECSPARAPRARVADHAAAVQVVELGQPLLQALRWGGQRALGETGGDLCVRRQRVETAVAQHLRLRTALVTANTKTTRMNAPTKANAIRKNGGKSPKPGSMRAT